MADNLNIRKKTTQKTARTASVSGKSGSARRSTHAGKTSASGKSSVRQSSARSSAKSGSAKTGTAKAQAAPARKSSRTAARTSAANTRPAATRKKMTSSSGRPASQTRPVPTRRAVSSASNRNNPPVKLYQAEPERKRQTLGQYIKSLWLEAKDNRVNGIYFDYNLLAIVIILMCFGLVMLYSTSAYESYKTFRQNDMYYFRHQAMIGLFAIVWAVLLSYLPYRLCIPIAFPSYLIALALMAMVKWSPLGVEVYGAKRWLKIGVQFQPSEIAKIAVIMFIPWLIIHLKKRMQHWSGFLIVFAFGGFQAFCAWKLTDNLSTGIIIMMIAFGLLYLADPYDKKYKVAICAAAGVSIPTLWFLSHNLHLLETSDGGFRMRRIYEWLSGGSYQVLQGLYAIGSGGFFGKGLGNSTQKLGTIPEAQNDMIFSILCEEFGLFGVLILIIMFGYMLYRLFFIAQNAPTLYASLMVSGVFIHISLQVILNLCVVLKILPTTGITLPFISYGGTSLIFLMTEIAIALSVSRSIRPLEE